MSTDKINERLTRTEETLKSHSHRIAKLETSNEALMELKTLVSLQTEVNKEQNNQMKEFSKTLGNINENLTHLNISQKQLENNMSKIGERVSSIEESQEGNKIDIPKLFVKILIGIAMLVPTIIGTYIMIRLGLK